MGLGDLLGGLLGSQNNFHADPRVNGFVAQQANLANSNYAPGIQSGMSGAQSALGQQQGYIDMLRGQMSGTGPSVAQALLGQQTDRNNAGAMSMAASQRGMNPGLAAKMAMDQMGANNQASAQSGALLRQQEMMNAQGLLGSALGQFGSQSMGLMGAAGGLQQGQNALNLQNSLGTQGLNQATAAQNANLGYQADALNAGVAGQNTASNNSLMGGVLGAAGSYLGLSPGGRVPGRASAPGDAPQNDKVPAMLSPEEIVLPRSVTMADDAPQRAADFVKALKGRMKKGAAEAPWKRRASEQTIPVHASSGYPNPDALANPQEPPPEMEFEPSTGTQIAPQSADPLGPFRSVIGQDYTPPANPAPTPFAGDTTPAATLTPTGAGAAKEAPAAQPSVPRGPNALAEFDAGNRQQIGGLKQEAGAAQDFAKHQTAVMDSWNGARQELNSKFQEALSQHQARSDALFNDVMQSKINPNQYWEHLSTGGKISSAIGLILGGLGSGLQGGPNHALETINKAIDRDVEAQKLNLGKKTNLLSHYMQMGRDLQQAHMLASADMHDAAAAQLARASAAYQGTKAAADAQVLIGAERQKASEQRQQAELTQFQIDNAKLTRSMMLRIAQGANAGGNAPAVMGKEMNYLSHPEKRGEEQVNVEEDVPTGVNDTQGNPLTKPGTRAYYGKSTAAMEKASEALMHNRVMDTSMKDLEKFSKEHPMGGEPGSASVGNAKAALTNIRLNYEATMAGMNRQASPEVLKHMDELIADPTQLFKTGKTAGSLQFIRKMINEHKRTVLDTYTLGPSQ